MFMGIALENPFSLGIWRKCSENMRLLGQAKGTIKRTREASLEADLSHSNYYLPIEQPSGCCLTLANGKKTYSFPYKITIGKSVRILANPCGQLERSMLAFNASVYHSHEIIILF